MYSLLNFNVQFVSASSAWVFMNPMDSVALRAIKAVISFFRLLVPLIAKMRLVSEDLQTPS